jgi:hemoglobin/transferrin/lactoferrin receptor protein
VGVVKHLPGKVRLELNGFHSILNNAIVRRPYTFNGKDSIFFDGTQSRVEALQNAGKATVWGIQAMAEVWFSHQFSAFTFLNYINGNETDDGKNVQVPLRHAPPFYGSSGLRYQLKSFRAELNAQYNAEVSNENLPPSEQTKTAIYATDENGKPYSPGWYTLNLRGSYAFGNATIGFAWENITNQRYRPFSSGIVSPGSNFIVSLRYGW